MGVVYEEILNVIIGMEIEREKWKIRGDGCKKVTLIGVKKKICEWKPNVIKYDKVDKISKEGQ
jgi:hypothetical protein